LAGCLAILLLGACAPKPQPAELPVRVARLEPVLAKTPFGKTVAEAVRSSPELSASAAEIAVAQAELSEAQSAARPGLTLGLDLAASAALGQGFGSRNSAVVKVTQLLFDGGATKRRVEAAEISVQREAYLRDAATAQTALGAVEAWINLIQQRQIRNLAVENEATHQDFFEKVQELSDAGVGTQVDYLSAQSRLAQATARKAAAINALAHAEADYRQIFATLPTHLPSVPTGPSLPAQSDDGLIKTSPRLQSLDAEIDAAAQLVAAAEAARQPPVSFEAGVGYDPTLGDPAVSVGVSPRFEVSNGGRRNAVVAQAKARLARLQAERDQLARDIRRTLQVLRADQRSGRATVAAGAASVKAHTATVGAVDEQFSTGRQSISQLLDAQRDLFDASESLIRARSDLKITQYAALALTGDIIDVFGLTPPVPDETAE